MNSMNPKRLLGLVLAACMMLSLAACDNGKGGASSDVTPASSYSEAEQEEYIKLANEMTNKLTLREYTEVYSKFDDTMKKSMDEEALKKTWLDTAGDIGKFDSIITSRFDVADGYVSVTDKLLFTERALDVRWVFNDKREISGLWMQYVSMPPEPVSTDKFEEVLVEVGAEGYRMNGLLTLPKGVKKPPVVILVHGSGSSDLNETIGSNRPFMDIAYGLAEQGVAVLRYDKRYFALPERVKEDIVDLTVQDEVLDDVASAIALLKKDERVNSEQIFILGHSLGGMLAPKIAADNDGSVAGIISMAGSLRKIQEIMYTQAEEKINSNAVLSDEQKKADIASYKEMVDQINAIDSAGYDAVMGYPASYWFSMNEIDNFALAGNLSIPVLVLQGDADFQVSAEIDYPIWREAMGEGPHVTYKLYEGLNHLMIKTNGKRDETEYDTAGKVEQTVIDDIANFIKTPLNYEENKSE